VIKSKSKEDSEANDIFIPESFISTDVTLPETLKVGSTEVEVSYYPNTTSKEM
jgi:hypothetical protein